MQSGIENYVKIVEMAMVNLGTFESLGYEKNETVYWRASIFMQKLGYTEMKAFQLAINRAIKACMSMSIDFTEHFIFLNELEKDYELTRFACYLIAMNADVRKAEVAKAQMYFIQQTRQLELIIENATEELDRFIIREELKEGNKELLKAAQKKGVKHFDSFLNQGYLGLYNMNLTKLKERRGLGKRDNPADFMGRTELAANLFRVTQAEERIKNDPRVNSQAAAEKAHYQIASQVRDMVIANTNVLPESMPVARKIEESKKDFKKLGKDLGKLNSPKKRKSKPQ
ncbi:MAG: damage-inducible protein [Bacteroidetes bacterium]|nr:damage-inducible protein [Bacteroidota bacterium]